MQAPPLATVRRKYVLWRYALVCERLRCEPWRPGDHSHPVPGYEEDKREVVFPSPASPATTACAHAGGACSWSHALLSPVVVP